MLSRCIAPGGREPSSDQRRHHGPVKPGLILINTARGEVVDEVALSQALHDGTIGGRLMCLTANPTSCPRP